MIQASLFDRGSAPARRSRVRIPTQTIPLSTGDCATFMGKSREFIRLACERGELQASYVVTPHNRQGRYVITPQSFRAYLIHLQWPHLPRVEAQQPQQPQKTACLTHVARSC